MKEIIKQIRLLPMNCCIILGALAFFLKFCVPGYSFSALVCCGIIALIVFYEGSRILRPKFPKPITVLRILVTICLIIGLIAFGITEFLIFDASSGDPDKQCDYFVVLGAKVRESGPSISLWDRIYGAAGYMYHNPDTIAVVSGGQGNDEPMTEGMAMFVELVDLGIDPERILVENRATSTRENILFALDLIEEQTGSRPKTLGVVSSEYHLFRASLIAKDCGVEFVGIPATTSRLPQYINHMMREVAGVWQYVILGG